MSELKPHKETFRKTYCFYNAKQFKTKQNTFLLVGVWSSLDTVRHFDHVSAVKAYRTRMIMI